jgi:hypothetical protein
MRHAARTTVFILTLAVAAATTANGMFALGHAVHTERIGMNLMVMFAIPLSLRTLEAHSHNPTTYTVAFMGDSTVISYPEGQTVDAHLQETADSMWPGPGRIHVESLSSLGMSPGSFYLIQDEVAASRPDIAIVTANLGMIRDPFPPHLKQPGLAGWVSVDRFYDTLVRLDLHKFGVTTDRLLIYKLFVTAKRAGNWMIQTQHQARLGHLRKAVESAVAEKTGWTGETTSYHERFRRNRDKLILRTEPDRLNEVGAKRRTRELMAGIDEDHWTVEVLQAILEEFADAGTSTVLYVPPINVEHLRSVGVYDEAGLTHSLETLERIATKTGAEFADLHDLLPDVAFRDTGGHFTHAAPFDGPALVAEALTPYVLLQARALAQAR